MNTQDQPSTAPSADEHRAQIGIDRRQALRAALGGAAAAAAFAAPRVEGFSVAPDYAAAASCTSASAATNWSMPGQTLGRICWSGNTFAAPYNGDECSTPRVVAPFVVAAGIGSAPDLVATVTAAGFYNGTVGNNIVNFPSTSGGTLNVQVNGIQNHTNQNCTVGANHSASCGGWTGTGPFTLNNSGANQKSVTTDFNCDYRITAADVTVTVTCVCS